MTDSAEAFWDDVYRRRDGSGHGGPHPYLLEVLRPAVPGRALDLGCGNGTTAVWLASLGWSVTAVDVSGVALRAAAGHAERAGVSSRITWEHADLRDWTTQETFDLVTALFLHTPLELDAPALLARAAARTREQGTLLTISHYTLPPWAWDPAAGEGLLSASELAGAIGVDEPDWRIIVAQEMSRRVTHGQDQAGTVLDAVLHAVRASASKPRRET